MSDRQIEMTLDIEADRDLVWDALTDARELMRWFPLKAIVNPGAGGNIHLSWGRDMTGDCPIDAWQPGEHLRLFWWEGDDHDPSRRLTVDFHIESRGASTRLRMIHSGFGDDASWDEEYDGISRGWNFELRCLRVYLENHIGRDRQVALRRLPMSGSAVQAIWPQLIGENGLIEFPSASTLKPHDIFNLRLPQGKTSSAELLVLDSPKEFAASVAMLDDGIIRLSAESCGGAAELWVWATSWTVPEDALNSLVEEWCQRIAGLDQAAA